MGINVAADGLTGELTDGGLDVVAEPWARPHLGQTCGVLGAANVDDIIGAGVAIGVPIKGVPIKGVPITGVPTTADDEMV